MKPVALAFRPLYARIIEGYETNAIVAYGKRPHEYRDEPLTLEGAAFGTDMKFRRTLYEHSLQVELWFLVVRFCWYDK